MVTGGAGRVHAPLDLDSTEIFSGEVWRTVAGKLPKSISFMSGVTINNRVLIFGKKHIIFDPS